MTGGMRSMTGLAFAASAPDRVEQVLLCAANDPAAIIGRAGLADRIVTRRPAPAQPARRVRISYAQLVPIWG